MLPTDSLHPELWLPYPIARSLKSYRDVSESRPFERIDALTKVMEVTVKLLASISVKGYLVTGNTDVEFRETVRQLGRMSLGHWIKLLRLSLKLSTGKDQAKILADLNSYYQSAWWGDKEVSTAVPRLCSGSQGAIANPSGKLTTAALFDVLVNFRNFVAHGTRLTDDEWNLLLPDVEVLVRKSLARLEFFKTFVLFYVGEVKVDKSSQKDSYVHEGQLCIGREIERSSLTRASALRNQRIYLVEYSNDLAIYSAIDLFPLWIQQSCPGCRRSQLFGLNGIKDKRVDYISYECGHRLDLRDSTGEVNSFVEGAVSLDKPMMEGQRNEGFSKKSFGATDKERREAQDLAEEATHQMEVGLSNEAMQRLEVSLQLNPDAADHHYLAGLCRLLTQGSVLLAVESFQEAVRLNPDSAEAHFALAYIYRQLRASTLASSHVQAAISKDPANGLYRQFQVDRPSPGIDVSAQEIDYSSADVDVQELSGFAHKLLSLKRLSRFRFRHWAEALPPWCWVRRSPFIGSTVVVGAILLGVVLAQGSDLSTKIVLQQVSIALNIWGFIYVMFVGTISLPGRCYRQLRPVVKIPEETFRRFFIQQCSYMLGYSCVVTDGVKPPGAFQTLRQDWRHAVIALTFFLLLLPLQYWCAQDPFEWRVPALARYSTYVFEAYTGSWAAAFCLLGLRFIPGFSNLPQRYFLGMPDSVSLRPLGEFFLDYALLATALCLPFFLFQHYVFRTIQTVPVIHSIYIVVVVALVLFLLVFSQLIVRQALTKLKVRKLMEFSYHVESAFNAFVDAPGRDTFERLNEQRKYMQELQGLETSGFSRQGRVKLLVIVLWLVALFGGYAFLITQGIWLS